MLRRVLPKTMVGQLMAMLVIVLLFAQLINLLILVGEQRIQARSKAFNGAIEHSVRLISNLPEELPITLPYALRNKSGGPQGAFFLSEVNRAKHGTAGQTLSRYSLRFQSALEARSITVLQTSVTFLPDGPVRNRRPPPGGHPNDGRPDGDRFGEDRRPPPPHKGRPRPPQDGLYHPPYAPRPGGPKLGGPREQGLQELRLSAEIEDGIWFNAMVPHNSTESLTERIVLATALLLGLVLLAAWFFVKRISRPLTNFTRAAERLGRGDNPETLEETGPADIRAAANAFNVMQSRLTQTLRTQRTMLRAVGHDLRTPLTSLRIRAENIPPELGKDKFIATIDDMTVMTEEILNWAKDASGTEELASVDLEALLASLTDDYQDQGRNVSLKGFQTMTVRIRRTSIKRALQNLINNALDYGHKAEISVDKVVGRILIHVDDIGPGVPETQLPEMTKPFVRLETSRNKDTGGTGLGLSIVESIAQIHGGQLILQNIKPNGLRATLALPL